MTHPHSAKLWWLGISIPTVVLVEMFGIVTAAVFILVVLARGFEHLSSVRS